MYLSSRRTGLLEQVILLKLVEKEDYFKFQFIDLKNKEIIDGIDEDMSSDPHFQDFSLMTKEINKPVLIIAGEFDDAVGPHHHQSFKFRNSKVIVLESSHHPYTENQLEFKEAILDVVIQ